MDNNGDNLDTNPVEDVDDSFQSDIFDPRYWDSLDAKQTDILAEKGAKRDLSIQKGPRDRYSRRFCAQFYTRVLSNGEHCDRDWLVYSKELDRVFCLKSSIEYFASVVNYSQKGTGKVIWQMRGIVIGHILALELKSMRQVLIMF